MKYVIDEEELNEHIFSKLTYWLKASSQLDDIIVNRGKCADDITESFLKSKTPVEVIAEGEVLIDFESGTTDILQGSNLRPIENIFKKEHRSVPVRIYIEVIK